MDTDNTLCPHCGGNLDGAAALRAGPYTYSDIGGFRVEGRSLGLTNPSQILLGTIMRAGGVAVQRETLAAAIGTKAANSANVIQVQLCRAKKTFEAEGLPWPIVNRYRTGRCWTGPTLSDV